MNLKQAKNIVSNLESSNRGWTASDYTDSINTSGFLLCDGCTVEINWDRIEEFANEVAALAIKEHANTKVNEEAN